MTTTNGLPLPSSQPPALRLSPSKTPANTMASSWISSTRSWRTALLALSLAFWIHWYNQFAPLDTFLPPTEIDYDVEKHFSDTYYEARALFRERTRATQAELHTLPLAHLKDLDLTIDVSVFPGASDKVVIHISGTHGVEGFAGSAIQSALLERLGNVSEAKSESPTLIFVHALNPYGMAMLRRFNEHNVDLNRNFLTLDGFKQRASQDPNTYGYVDLMDALNPPHPTTLFAWLKSWATIAHYAFKHSVTSVKQAVVVGHAHFPTSLNYGGEEFEPSAQLLFQFLRKHLAIDALRSVGVIDVHTGLGPTGYDTLMVDAAANTASLHNIFEDRHPVTNGDTNDGPSSGYKGATGLLCSGFSWLLPDHVHVVCLTQEFGTLAAPFVLNALIQENAMFQHAPSRRLPYAQQLRDAFYLHGSVQWKADVVARGVTVWEELVAHVLGDISADIS